jgi:ubiquitin-protein ligase E3 D
MKIFYRSIAYPEALLTQNSLEYEELCLPLQVLTELHDTLKRSSNSLPISARKFKEWDVGLIDRSNES